MEADVLVQPSPQQRVHRAPGRRPAGRRVAQELLDRRNHRGRLLGRRSGLAHLDPRARGRVLAVSSHRRVRVSSPPRVPEIPVFDNAAVLKAVTPLDAIERVRDGFVRHAAREWEMPPKTYLLAPPNGDFRAMPARGSGLAMLKWITSFPVNPARGLPAVMGVIWVSSEEDGRPLALIDAQAVTALRTGAVAAIAAQELAREDASSAGII